MLTTFKKYNTSI